MTGGRSPTIMMNPTGVPYERYQEAEDARVRWWTGLRAVFASSICC